MTAVTFGTAAPKPSSGRFVVTILQRPPSRAIHVLILTAFERPEEGEQTEPAEKQRDGNQERQHVHAICAPVVIPIWTARCSSFRVAFRSKPLRRSALVTTMIEDVDMAMAAIMGVAKPARAIGTAMML